MNKSKIIAEFRKSENDTGSSAVQIALLTNRIKSLTEHLKSHRKDFHSRRGLVAMANRRRKLLSYLKNNEPAEYEQLIKKLNLRK